MMFERIYLLMEILAYLIIIFNLFNKNFRLDFPAVLMISVDVVFYVAIGKTEFNSLYLMMPFLFLLCYSLWEFKMSLKETVIKMLLTVMSLGIIQLIVGLGTFFLDNNQLRAFVVNLFSLVFVVGLAVHNIFYKMVSYINKNSKVVFHILVSCAGIFLVLLICYRKMKSLSLLEYLLILLGYLVFIKMLYIWKSEHEKFKYKTKKLAVFQDYQMKGQDLYSEIQRKQHEFKNQLNAIYSTHYTCRTYEELVESQKKYADWLKKDHHGTDLLLSCKPPVLAGFIYSQIERAKKSGVKMAYSISITQMENTDMEYDYICILGILFDNAVEAVLNQYNREPQIELFLNYDGENAEIKVGNCSPHIKNNDIVKWFDEKYSTKGEKRGYGLSNLVKLKEKYAADIIAENMDKQGENWIIMSFKIKGAPH